MSSRVHQIHLSEAMEKQLHERARAAGTDPDSFLLKTIEEKLHAPRTFKKLFAPLQEALADGNESPEVLEQTLEQLRDSTSQSRGTDKT